MNNCTELVEAIKNLTSAVRGCEVSLTIIFLVLIFKNTNSDTAIYNLGTTIRDALAFKSK